MMILFSPLTFALALLSIQGTWSQDKGKGRGLGEHFNWLNLEDGLRVAREERKPLMVIIHKSWCGASQVFRDRFARSQSISEAAPNFVMVNIEDDDDPHHPALEPDGAYVPRILFFGMQRCVHV
ncbi:unnamed protein product [Darwinula stevensoni]|uniref:Thioredoxin domain-containing protein 12 n=1 Tax=Darwinula stevensoni TaxID=69355 RepID=A0A7R9A0E0_9CRUS|nr:unnamed protein product [Darwinula stevensoni]CAG0880870.1 unnamed protein product [Darwinula stevensoni]